MPFPAVPLTPKKAPNQNNFLKAQKAGDKLLPFPYNIVRWLFFKSQFAGVAQLVEQLIRNQQVVGSSPISSSKKPA